MEDDGVSPISQNGRTARYVHFGAGSSFLVMKLSRKSNFLPQEACHANSLFYLE